MVTNVGEWCLYMFQYSTSINMFGVTELFIVIITILQVAIKYDVHLFNVRMQ